MVQAETTTGFSTHSLHYLCQIVEQDSGILLDESKRYLLDARLKPLIQTEGISSLDQLCAALQGGQKTLRRKVVEAMATHESLFFRDTAPFDALREVILPELVERRSWLRRLSFWCAACSSGQEPYSLAMLLCETLPQIDSWAIDILASDISEPILKRAREARYMQLEVNRGLPVQYLVKYFERAHMDWVVKPKIRDMVKFQYLNLMDDFQDLGKFDVVMCRNVMIYFDVDRKKQILAGIRQVLAPDGYLLLGGSETVFSLDDNYERVAMGQATYYRLRSP